MTATNFISRRAALGQRDTLDLLHDQQGLAEVADTNLPWNALTSPTVLFRYIACLHTKTKMRTLTDALLCLFVLFRGDRMGSMTCAVAHLAPPAVTTVMGSTGQAHSLSAWKQAFSQAPTL